MQPSIHAPHAIENSYGYMCVCVCVCVFECAPEGLTLLVARNSVAGVEVTVNSLPQQRAILRQNTFMQPPRQPAQHSRDPPGQEQSAHNLTKIQHRGLHWPAVVRHACYVRTWSDECLGCDDVSLPL